MGCGGSNAGSQLAQQQAQQQANTNAAIAQIDQAFSGFTPDFYNSINKAYQQYALPQLQQQYQGTQNQLGFKLAGQGLGNSSVAQDLYNKLYQQNTQNTQQVAQQGLQQAQQSQQQVAQEKANLYGQAQSATNPSALGQAAISSAASLSAPSTFTPIGNLFSNFATQYLGNQLAQTYNPYTNSLMNPYSMRSSGAANFLPATSY